MIWLCNDVTFHDVIMLLQCNYVTILLHSVVAELNGIAQWNVHVSVCETTLA